MNTREKILGREALTGELAAEREKGRRIVFANGCFDILHVGHVRYLAAAREEGDVLVVGVNSDSSTRTLKGSARPILAEMARAELVAALAVVDYVTIFEELNVEALLTTVRPHVHAKGTDYSAETVPERELAARLGIRVAITGDPKNHSTRDLIATVRDRANG